MTDNQVKLQELHASSLASIIEMVEALDHDDDEAREAAEQTIHEDPLSVEVRSGWHLPGDRSQAASTEYRILLGTGGPAVQIVGELDEHSEPETAHLEVQDWFLPWTRFPQTKEETEALLSYARCFYFGEG